ncbi:2' O-ribose methyltransferase [Coemansia sp. RSA 1813]|nr:2' O-ribose methyltransferase [Coemansia sp. RSA 1646]KAJ1774071.1 2' O-ribose methyltransferase [Coemansia sp. RSA 1843]KAJ2092538.1 2' O-ribose methyltransferase [Coemansia sp. RSA 986]KAJ2216767.1 2' O-ribose methyltransferase [Coemansia sp. RSA 487]KAJ2572839.1 2' O-ribose methyltransferase [Coemansia sp. RSA 1813]
MLALLKALAATRGGLRANNAASLSIGIPFANNAQQKQNMSSKKKKGGSSYRYMERQTRDPFVKKAQAEQFRARSSFKLMELIDKHRLIPQSPMCVVDCGAAPGGWSQVIARKMNAHHECSDDHKRIVAIDILAMQAIPGVYFVRGDFLEPTTKQQIAEVLGHRKVGLLLSDMAPAFTGHHSVDADRTMNLCEDVVSFSDEFLACGGSMVLKFFMGGKESDLRKELRRRFSSVQVEKPEASRKQSSEQYLVCLNKVPQDHEEH